ncbi:MAG: FHA domain-containing protein [Bacteroidetes bacterium]|nr:MAG: FHA domain-containing protein [Bacteroidota bacterium]
MEKYRYPGPDYFTEEDADLFFGRSKVKEELERMIRLEKMIVLHSRSGLGKTSLLKAGIIPIFKNDKNFAVFDIRFGSFHPSDDLRSKKITSPYEELIKQIKARKHPPSNSLEKVGVAKDSLWYLLKSFVAKETDFQGILLIFDQFEELASYEKEDIATFTSRLSELLHQKTPANFSEKVDDLLDENEAFVKALIQEKSHPQNFELAEKLQVPVEELKDKLTNLFWTQTGEFEQLFEEDIKNNPTYLTVRDLLFFEQPIQLNVVLSIRSDRIGFLDKLSGKLPFVLYNLYELDPLSKDQAEEALVVPASKEGDFSRKESFQYSPKALEAILDHLSMKDQVEPFQLQYIGEHVEKNIIKPKIEFEDLGNLDQLFNEYYENKIESISDEEVQHKVRKLIEEGLIFENTGTRLSLLKEQINEVYGVDDDTLEKLVSEIRLLRSEDIDDKKFYEIPHDTLVKPILESKKRREEAQKVRENRLAKLESIHEELKQAKEMVKQGLSNMLDKPEKAQEQFGNAQKIYQSITGKNVIDQMDDPEFFSILEKIREFEFELILNFGKLRTNQIEENPDQFLDAIKNFEEALDLAKELTNEYLKGQANEGFANAYEKMADLNLFDLKGTKLEYYDMEKEEENIERYYVKAQKCYSLSGENHGDDARILEHLANLKVKKIKELFDAYKDIFEASGNVQRDFGKGAKEYEGQNSDLIRKEGLKLGQELLTFFEKALYNYRISNDQIAIRRVESEMEEQASFLEEWKQDAWGFVTNLKDQKTYKLSFLYDQIYIGRNAGKEAVTYNHIGFEPRVVSRRHIMIHRIGTVEDWRSRNGTHLNGRLIPFGNSFPLVDGDIIVLANIIPLLFSEQKPQLTVQPTDWAAVFLDCKTNKIIYLQEGERYYIGRKGMESVLKNEEDYALYLDFTQPDQLPVIFVPDGEWDLISTIKMSDYEIKSYIFNKNQQFSLNSGSYEWLRLNEDKSGILEEGPILQIILNDKYLDLLEQANPKANE